MINDYILYYKVTEFLADHSIYKTYKGSITRSGTTLEDTVWDLIEQEQTMYTTGKKVPWTTRRLTLVYKQ